MAYSDSDGATAPYLDDEEVLVSTQRVDHTREQVDRSIRSVFVSDLRGIRGSVPQQSDSERNEMEF